MTTMDASPSIGSVIAMKIAARLAKRKEVSASNRARTWQQAISRFVLHIAGFSFLTYAGFTWSTLAGLIVAGLSCFALSSLIAASPSNAQPRQNPNPGDHLSRR